ncbi:transcriptional repressor LexA, partial [bacterium]
MITKRQKQVLDFITAYQNKKSFSPSLEEIKKYLGLSSVSTAHHHVKNLQEEGYLQKEYNQARSVAPINSIETVEIPLLGIIAAGRPIEAIENPDETIILTKDTIGKHGKYYALRVQGSSMIDEGIFDGDIVVIRQQPAAENGQTVVAIIDDNEATLKKLYREKNRIRLQPANPDLFPIFRTDVEIKGIVVKIIRNLETPIQKENIKDDKFKRRIDFSWDYKGEKTKSYTHGLHMYPAMFIPQVAKRLLQTYSKEGDTICDIFCGSGTTLIESLLLGRNSYGIDLNPFAIFLAKAKTTKLSPSIL